MSGRDSCLIHVTDPYNNRPVACRLDHECGRISRSGLNIIRAPCHVNLLGAFAVLQRLNMAPPATSHCALQLLQENIYGRGNGDNPLKNAPHTHELLLEPEWTHPYTKFSRCRKHEWTNTGRRSVGSITSRVTASWRAVACRSKRTRTIDMAVALMTRPTQIRVVNWIEIQINCGISSLALAHER